MSEPKNAWKVFPNEKPAERGDVLLSWGYDTPVLGFYDGSHMHYRVGSRALIATSHVWWHPLPETPQQIPEHAIRTQEEQG
jgi:hypothetical protein